MLAGFALVVVFSPSQQVAALAVAPVAAFVAYWVLQNRRIEAAGRAAASPEVAEVGAKGS